MIYISKIKLHNFKSFDDLEIKFDSGINFLVGDNNCGKTTIFSAIDFILSGKDRDSYITKDKILKDDYVSVEIILSGDKLTDYLDTNTVLKRYKKYIYAEDGSQNLIIRRSSKVEKSADGKDLDITKIRIIDKDTNEQHSEHSRNACFQKFLKRHRDWLVNNSMERLLLSLGFGCANLQLLNYPAKLF